MRIRKNYPLQKFTTMAIGGPARWFVAVESEMELAAAVGAAEAKNLRWYVVGEGSNLIASDRGFDGVIIQNKIERLVRRGRSVVAGAGNNLLQTIFKLDRLGLSGMEKMAGIPGTVGGAICGCAGAYGQEIRDCLACVWYFDGRGIKKLNKKQCRFGYRTSIFKRRKNWVIVAAEFRLKRGAKGARGLMGVSKGIIKLREKKYPPGLRCPGSFFKNIKLSDLKVVQRPAFIKKIPADRIMYGKVPAGYLLEQVNAKGMRMGRVAVANHHANLIFNPGGGRSRDVEKLARKLKKLVSKKFGIMIEEEVQYL